MRCVLHPDAHVGKVVRATEEVTAYVDTSVLGDIEDMCDPYPLQVILVLQGRPVPQDNVRKHFVAVDAHLGPLGLAESSAGIEPRQRSMLRRHDLRVAAPDVVGNIAPFLQGEELSLAFFQVVTAGALALAFGGWALDLSCAKKTHNGK